MSSVEEVLVISRDKFEFTLGAWANTGGILTGEMAHNAATEILKSENLFFVERADAETDESLKQIIPYVLIKRGNEVFRYERSKKGGENRLHNKHSIGVGGHIEPKDLDFTDDNIKRDMTVSYWNAFYRELHEEIGFDSTTRHTISAPIVGLIYDSSDSVGRVHLGICHILNIRFDTKLEFLDESIAGGRFEHVLDLKQSTDNFEKWSKLVIENLL